VAHAADRALHGDVLPAHHWPCHVERLARREANAAGLSNFLRTLAGAFATSLVQTGWEDATRRNQTELARAMTHGNAVIDSMTSGGVSHETATGLLTQLVSGQSVMLATLNIFAVVAAGSSSPPA
jgi:DHA2 family multidrug resistance protein